MLKKNLIIWSNLKRKFCKKFCMCSNSVMNSLKCLCLTELFPIYQNKHWTIRQQDNNSFWPMVPLYYIEDCRILLSMTLTSSVGSFLKPNYFKKQIYSSSFLLTWSKLSWSPQQASSMHLKHETTLSSTSLTFWTCINKKDDKEHYFLKWFGLQLATL